MSVWNEAVPSGTSAVGQFPGWAHAVFSTIGAGLGIENYFLGSGGVSDASHVAARPGGSRAYVDVQSNSSTPTSQSTGRLFLASDVSRLFAYFSTGTYLVGTAFAVETDSDASTGYWARQTGSFTTTALNAQYDVPFAVPYLVAPTVTQSIGTGAGASRVVLIGSTPGQSTTTKFRSLWSTVGGVGGFTVFWEALGIVSSASY